jgi:nucleoside-diphosphate-sugar epimerase
VIGVRPSGRRAPAGVGTWPGVAEEAGVDVTVFGGTGKIGLLVLQRLLDDGHRVTALVRSPGKLDLEHPDLHVVVAELSDVDAVDRAVEGADAVISTLGPPIDPLLTEMPLTEGTRTIVAAMHRHGVRRIVALSTVSVPDPRDRPSVLERLVPIGIGVLIPGALREVQGITEVISTSELDWTIARIFAPVDNPSNHTLKAGFLGRDAVGVPMTRVDIAGFLVDQLTSDEFVGAAPAISN